MKPHLLPLTGLFLLGGCSSPETPTPEKIAANTPKPKPAKTQSREDSIASATARAWDAAPPVSSSTEEPVPTPYPVAKRFSEDERRDIFRQIVEAEDRGSKEAEEAYPTDLNNPSLTVDAAKANVEPNAELSNKLEEKYRSKVIRKFRLSERERSLISVEGIEKHWPPLYE